MKISIVTPVYNDPRIERCLQSVGSQVGDFDLEHIVVDSMSDDETVDVIDEYSDQIDHLIREPDDGVYDAMNKGVTRAEGDVVGILNSDDRYQDDSVLADVVETMTRTGADASYGDLIYVDDQDQTVRYWHSGSYDAKRFYLGWMPPHPTFFVRNHLYDEYGVFDTQFEIAADYDLMLRFLLRNEVSVAYVERVLVRMAMGGQSNASIRNMAKAVKEMYLSWKKYQLAGRFVAPFAHPLEKVPQYLKNPPEGLDSSPG